MCDEDALDCVTSGARWYQTRHDSLCTTAAKHRAPPQQYTVRLSERMGSSKAHCQLICLSKYRMCQQATVDNQYHKAVHEDFANGVIKATHSLRSHKFVLWVCNELHLDLE
jgi:diphthamide biosynthesis methyltransferase